MSAWIATPSRPAASSARLAASSGGAAQARLPAVGAAQPCALRSQCCLACGAGLDARPWLATLATSASPKPTAGSRACARRRGCAPQTPDGGWGRLARCRGPTGFGSPRHDRSRWGGSQSRGCGWTPCPMPAALPPAWLLTLNCLEPVDIFMFEPTRADRLDRSNRTRSLSSRNFPKRQFDSGLRANPAWRHAISGNL